jgi:capsular polysaccharide biosynthesis protein
VCAFFCLVKKEIAHEFVIPPKYQSTDQLATAEHEMKTKTNSQQQDYSQKEDRKRVPRVYLSQV